MQAKSEGFLDNFNQIIEMMKWRVFVRTDDCNTVYPQHYKQYNVCPAFHMNLAVSDALQNAYIDSGYLSTFEFSGNAGLKAVNSYLNYLKVHFIFLPEIICDEFHLTGGTSGFEKIDEITYLRKAEGTAWDTPVRNQYIPQVFNTERMLIALKPGDTRYNYELLLGGNWQDYAICITLSKQQALEIEKSKYTNEHALFADLKKYNPYFPVSQTPQEHARKVQVGLIAKYLQEWWKKRGKERQLLCFLYAVAHEEHYREPIPEHDFSMLASLFDMAIKLDALITRCPSLWECLCVLQNGISHTTQLITYDPESYKVVLNFLKNQLKELGFLDSEGPGINPSEIEKRLYDLKLFHEILIVEQDFWQCINHYDHFNFQSSEIITIKNEALSLIQKSYSNDSFFLEEKLRIKLEKITASIKFIKEKLAEFLNRNYILNSGFQLLSDPKFSSAKGQSFIYCLGEWYNIWAKNIFGIIQSLSSQTLYQQAKHCEQIKNNLILLQEFYDQYKHSASPNKKFLREFDKQVIDTINEVKNALEQNPSLDVGRYILERTNQLIGLMGVQLSRRSDIFYIASIRQRLERLNEVRKPDLAAPQRMEESISSFASP